MGYRDYQFDVLKGKSIISIEWSEQKIVFNMKDMSVCFNAFGDCCSSSYIESLDNPEVFKDAIFNSAESIEGEQKELTDYNVHKWTFYKFKTSKGSCTLSFRNESNGYYDGYLELIEEKICPRNFQS